MLRGKMQGGGSYRRCAPPPSEREAGCSTPQRAPSVPHQKAPSRGSCQRKLTEGVRREQHSPTRPFNAAKRLPLEGAGSALARRLREFFPRRGGRPMVAPTATWHVGLLRLCVSPRPFNPGKMQVFIQEKEKNADFPALDEKKPFTTAKFYVIIAGGYAPRTVCMAYMR